MLKISEEEKNLYLSTLIKWLKSIDSYSEELFDEISNDLKNAPMSINKESGLSSSGSLLYILVNKEQGFIKYINSLNQLLPESYQIDKKSLTKVILLHQIAKSTMFEPNTNEWEIKKLNLEWQYKKQESSMRCGSRSLWLCQNYGIKFTPIEAEAMLIMDKEEDDNYYKYHLSTLSMIVKMANEFIYKVYQNKYKEEKYGK